MDRMRIRVLLPLSLLFSMYAIAVVATLSSNQRFMYALYVPPLAIFISSAVDIFTTKSGRVLPILLGVSFLFLSIISMMILVVSFGGI